ncbi:hypothetical protein BH11ACT6_BH11ACT6_12640 [soil metagenome]
MRHAGGTELIAPTLGRDAPRGEQHSGEFGEIGDCAGSGDRCTGRRERGRVAQIALAARWALGADPVVPAGQRRPKRWRAGAFRRGPRRLGLCMVCTEMCMVCIPSTTSRRPPKVEHPRCLKCPSPPISSRSNSPNIAFISQPNHWTTCSPEWPGGVGKAAMFYRRDICRDINAGVRWLPNVTGLGRCSVRAPDWEAGRNIHNHGRWRWVVEPSTAKMSRPVAFSDMRLSASPLRGRRGIGVDVAYWNRLSMSLGLASGGWIKLPVRHASYR